MAVHWKKLATDCRLEFSERGGSVTGKLVPLRCSLRKHDWHDTSEHIAVAESHGCLVVRESLSEVGHADGILVTAVNWYFQPHQWP